jgi:hypothetical protein
MRGCDCSTIAIECFLNTNKGTFLGATRLLKKKKKKKLARGFRSSMVKIVGVQECKKSPREIRADDHL